MCRRMRMRSPFVLAQCNSLRPGMTTGAAPHASCRLQSTQTNLCCGHLQGDFPHVGGVNHKADHSVQTQDFFCCSHVFAADCSWDTRPFQFTDQITHTFKVASFTLGNCHLGPILNNLHFTKLDTNSTSLSSASLESAPWASQTDG